MRMHKSKMTGIILAGGESKRMGTDKGLLVWKGKIFVQHVIDALEPLVKKIIIVSDYGIYHDLGYTCIVDKCKNAGPIAGIYTGLSESDTELNWVLSCDVPLITTALLEKILYAKKAKTSAIICEAGGKRMPLIGLYEKKCADICLAMLRNKKYKVNQFINRLEKIQIHQLDGKWALQTRNINTLQDFKRMENEG